jgi:hypothetical protein
MLVAVVMRAAFRRIAGLAIRGWPVVSYVPDGGQGGVRRRWCVGGTKSTKNAPAEMGFDRGAVDPGNRVCAPRAGGIGGGGGPMGGLVPFGVAVLCSSSAWCNPGDPIDALPDFSPWFSFSRPSRSPRALAGAFGAIWWFRYCAAARAVPGTLGVVGGCCALVVGS